MADIMDTIWNWICALQYLWRGTLSFIMILGAITVFSLTATDLDPASHTIAIFNSLLLFSLAILNIGILYKCKLMKRKEIKQEKDIEAVD